MRAAARLRPAAAEDDAVFDDHRADRRIGPGIAEPAAAERERQPHEACVIGRRSGGRRRRRRGLGGFAHLRAAAGLGVSLGSSSPDNSASASLEVLRLAEIPVDRGEAHIGDVVELAQMLHHRLADRLRGDFALALALELAHDLGHHLLDALGLDRALAQRDLHRAHQLVAVERHAAAVALDHGQLAQLHALEGGEAEIAGQADAAAADHRQILGRPRVLHLRVEASATRATHD